MLWEYEVISVNLDDPVFIAITLNTLGRKGWELVSVVGSERGSGSAYFKRPIPPA